MEQEEKPSEVQFNPAKVMPVRGMILVRIIPATEQVSSGGIHLVNERRRRYLIAEALRVGPEVWNVKEGDTLLLPETMGAEEAKFAFVNEQRDVYAIIENDA